ncbi:hypothetical protein BN12_530021 [Nostocoides japonicum T1-X7]|uniref:Uncharacterized protein n=1 Tax=Nostocoides japonicum T1-X7 TaxID=1194083 RepID=A0A077M3U1_9MICO|nr:hypothetical protein [Tetrasphaera japonica]CCH79687.1 hypothetical protein BN12_530021 [Tetrasphaera japonica T1-X7]
MFVIIEKRDNSVPSNVDIQTAMANSGGATVSIEGGNAEKTVHYTGGVNHTTFEGQLRQVARGRSTSWTFTWADRAQVAGTLGATSYTIDVAMSVATVTALVQGDYNLYGFKAVRTSQGGGAPLVWFQLPNTRYSTLTNVAWQVQYQAYTSTSSIIAGGRVTASFNADIDLGQTLNVVAGGTGDVTNDGNARAISVLNTTTQQFTCGVSEQAADGEVNPMCAFPLYGQQKDVIAPIQKVLLMFSTNPVNTGTVIEQAYSPGVLIDLTGDSHRKVSYDINEGWSWGGFSWAQTVKANDRLVPLLIEQPDAAQASELLSVGPSVTV